MRPVVKFKLIKISAILFGVANNVLGVTDGHACQKKIKLPKNCMLKRCCLATSFICCAAPVVQPHLEKDSVELQINDTKKVRRLLTNIKRF